LGQKKGDDFPNPKQYSLSEGEQGSVLKKITYDRCVFATKIWFKIGEVSVRHGDFTRNHWFFSWGYSNCGKIHHFEKVYHLFLWAIAIAILDKIVYVQKP